MASYNYEQKFNSLTTGNLNTQDNWSGDTGFQVGTTLPYEGAKGVSIGVTSSGQKIVNTSIGSFSDGDFFIAVRTTDSVQNTINLRLYETTNIIVAIRFNAGNIECFMGGSYTTYSAFSANAWYVINIQWNNGTQTNQFRLRVRTGTTWGSWTSWVSTVNDYTTINEIDFIAHGTAYTAYFDTITPTDPTLVIPLATRLLLMGVGK